MKLKKELEKLKLALGILQQIDCNESENEEYRKLLKDNKPLPGGVACRNADVSIEFADFYTTEESTLSKDELAEYIQYKQLSTLITIKKCVLFFTIMAIISLVASFIAVLLILC